MRQARRRFLRLALLGAATLLLGSSRRAWGFEAVEPTASPELARRLLLSLRDVSSAQAVGAAFLRAMPEHADVHALVTRLLRDEPALSRSRSTGATRKLLRRCIREDFARERVVAVDGWLLAETEARLCALAVLV
jgi:hypothetical protein